MLAFHFHILTFYFNLTHLKSPAAVMIHFSALLTTLRDTAAGFFFISLPDNDDRKKRKKKRSIVRCQSLPNYYMIRIFFLLYYVNVKVYHGVEC